MGCNERIRPKVQNTMGVNAVYEKNILFSAVVGHTSVETNTVSDCSTLTAAVWSRFCRKPDSLSKGCHMWFQVFLVSNAVIVDICLSFSPLPICLCCHLSSSSSFSSVYPEITSDVQRHEYKREFDGDLREYKRLCAEMDDINDQLNKLSRQLDTLDDTSAKYQVRHAHSAHLQESRDRAELKV